MTYEKTIESDCIRVTVTTDYQTPVIRRLDLILRLSEKPVR